MINGSASSRHSSSISCRGGGPWPSIFGHGVSDAPRCNTIVGFADDIARQCAELQLFRPVVIGHSTGGRIAL
ncbi:alpha/beta fold hydrolase [Bradyrhizobium sp. BEA-2-5]|uniref:alpha/beta fold hydrolase n=1 Tax=Bradyrhizobium sp. BEA-2-5 TaxID=3080015 RepID=UPI00397DE482